MVATIIPHSGEHSPSPSRGRQRQGATSTTGNSDAGGRTRRSRGSRRRQGIYWLLTIPQRMQPDGFTELPFPDTIAYFKGQLEEGGTTGYRHYQVLVIFKRKQSLGSVQRLFPESHCELSRSDAADQYVWKEDTRVPDSQFEFGIKPVRRNNPRDWDAIWEKAKTGQFLEIEASVRVQHYRTLRAIASDFSQPIGIERIIHVFCGRTGTGKSRRAWSEAGLEAYPKDPRSKFWDGYQGQNHVVIDEFRGGIDVSHMLRWCDRYPVRVEIKGSSSCLTAGRIWITSNLHPRYWYPGLDDDTLDALLRRLRIVEFE